MTAPIDIPETFPDPGAVRGKRVVITGAGRGLGSLLAHAFSQAGAHVALVARTETDLKAVAAELPGPTLVQGGDVTDEDFNEAIADAVVRYLDATQDEEFEREVGIDLLVATARMWRSLGHHDREGRFRIDGVTGPDEYSAITDNNVYTNLMAQQNLRVAAMVAARQPDDAGDQVRPVLEPDVEALRTRVEGEPVQRTVGRRLLRRHQV